MKESRLVLWPQHGIYGTGRDMDEVFGLIETAEKAAEVYTYVCAQGGVRQTISDADLWRLAEAFGVTPKVGYLEEYQNGESYDKKPFVCKYILINMPNINDVMRSYGQKCVKC